ncbi:MAG: glycosyltransferase [Erysipelotrichaceae bacterium]|nr:glycosyltransferase [Erysipelotrichaceae bacterium]
MKYSVIIPVYQSEFTVARCLDSLLMQECSNAELIIVNDGSTDNCDEICRAYAKKYSNIKYFKKENGGVSSARNYGLKHSEGEYILFVDSDDAVTADYFATINKTVNENSDLTVFGIKFLNDARELCLDNALLDDKKKIAQYICEYIRRNKFNHLYSKVFRRNIIQKYGIKFNERLSIAEDLCFIFEYVVHISKLHVIQDCLYILDDTNQNSLSRKARAELGKQLFDANMSMYAALGHAEPDCKPIYLETLNWMFYRSAYSAFTESKKFRLSKKDEKKYIKEICALYKSAKIKNDTLKTNLIALPIWLEMVPLIRIMIRIK